MVGKTFTVADAAKALTDEYEVDEATALADAEKLVNDWLDAEIIER
jgi:hypothetical protein